MVDHQQLNHCFVGKEFYYKFFIDYLKLPEYAICSDAFCEEVARVYNCKVIGPLNKLHWFLLFDREADYVFFMLQHGNLTVKQ